MEGRYPRVPSKPLSPPYDAFMALCHLSNHLMLKNTKNVVVMLQIDNGPIDIYF